MNCPNCSHPNPIGTRNCLRCGASLAHAAPLPPTRPGAAPSAQTTPSPSAGQARPASPTPPVGPAQTSPLASLARLGIPVSPGQVVGVIGGVILGMVVARVLPYVYPIFSARLLDLVFGPGYSEIRDGFNTNFMTACTCCSSFMVAALASMALRGRKRPKR